MVGGARAIPLTSAPNCCNQSDSQPPFADLGVITMRRHRGRGVATYAAIRQLGKQGVADLVERYGDAGDAVPEALTDYIKGREGYDYSGHGKAGHDHTDFVPDEIIDRFCILGPPDEQLRRLAELRLESLTADQVEITTSRFGARLRLGEEAYAPTRAASSAASSSRIRALSSATSPPTRTCR